MSWAEMILGRDDPIFGALILQRFCFFFARETSFRRKKILHILQYHKFEFVISQNKLDF